MSTPNEFAILRNLQQALQAISLDGGYHYDVAKIAVKLDPNQDITSLIAPDGPRPIIILDVQPDEWEYSPAMRVEVTLPVKIHWVSDSVPTDDESLMSTYFNGCADVEKAIAVDISRGGNAIDTRIVQRTSSRAIDSAVVWAVIDTRIKTRRVYGQP